MYTNISDIDRYIDQRLETRTGTKVSYRVHMQFDV